MSSCRCNDLHRLEAVDESPPDVGGLRDALAQVQRVKAHLANIEARIAAQLQQRGDRTSLGVAVGRREAGRISQRAGLLGAVPALADALGAGEVGVGQVDALAAVAASTPVMLEHVDELVDLARGGSPDRVRERARVVADLWSADGGLGRFERQRASIRLARGVDDVTGMHRFGLELDPERAGFLSAAIDRRVEERFHAGDWAGLSNDQRGALALYELATSGGGEGQPGVQLGVMVDLPTLVDGLHAQSRIDVDGGGTVPVETIRRMGCEAEILPIVLGGPSGVLDVGRAQRMATTRQRVALRALHPTCGVPGCTVRFEHCQIHHQHWWRHGGRSDLDNMVPLCSRHHHDVHEGGFAVTIGPGHAVTWDPP